MYERTTFFHHFGERYSWLKSLDEIKGSKEYRLAVFLACVTAANSRQQFDEIARAIDRAATDVNKSAVWGWPDAFFIARSIDRIISNRIGSDAPFEKLEHIEVGRDFLLSLHASDFGVATIGKHPNDGKTYLLTRTDIKMLLSEL